jgi:glycosyltransferase involved in cell wall biosynthesis
VQRTLRARPEAHLSASAAGELRVIVSLQGRFHGFNLAAELDRQGMLQRLMTSQPRSRPVAFGVRREKVRSTMRYDALQRVAARLGLADRIPHLGHLCHDAYDRTVARRLEVTDLVVAWSGMALHTHRRARQLGALRVVERGSSHIAFQRDILEEEQHRWGLRGPAPVDAWAVEKELIEYAEADAIAIPSAFVRRSFVSRGVPESRLLQVPYGVDLREFHPAPKQTPGFRAIFVGALSLRKGIPDLLEAAKRAKAELWLVGPRQSEVEPILERYAGHYQYKGSVPQSRLPGFYAQADVFVIASIEEGLAMVIPQALACGLPVVCSTNSGGDDLVRDGVNGYVVPIRDPDALAKRIAALRDDPERLTAMKRAAVDSVAHGHSWRDYGLAVAARYRALAATRGRG